MSAIAEPERIGWAIIPGATASSRSHPPRPRGHIPRVLTVTSASSQTVAEAKTNSVLNRALINRPWSIPTTAGTRSLHSSVRQAAVSGWPVLGTPSSIIIDQCQNGQWVDGRIPVTWGDSLGFPDYSGGRGEGKRAWPSQVLAED